MSDAVLEQSRLAVMALCRDGRLIDRLSDCHLHLERLGHAVGLPHELAPKVLELVADLAYGGNSVPEALSVVPVADLHVLADRVVGLHEELVRLAPSAARDAP